MDDYQFRQLLKRLRLSWEGYRRVRKGVRKRLRRRMQQLGCRNVQEYFLTLDINSNARHHCELLMTVSISRFFRDRHLWQSLEHEILPSIIGQHTGKMKCWSAGCASGEEVYSFKILWHTIERHVGTLPKLEIWATDVNPDYLRKAQAGTYPQSSLREVPEALRNLHFKTGTKSQPYAIAEFVKNGIIWQLHNLLSDPPDTGFQLIFLRNSLLTYYVEEVKVHAFQKVLNALAREGLLIIGAHERIPTGAGGLLVPCGHPHIFQKGAS